MRSFVLNFKINLGVQFWNISCVHNIVQHKTHDADCVIVLNVQAL